MRPKTFLICQIATGLALAFETASCQANPEIQSSHTQCSNENMPHEICVTMAVSMPVNLDEPVTQTITVATPSTSAKVLIYTESTGREAWVFDGPTEFHVTTVAGAPTTVTTTFRVLEEGYFTLNGSAAIEGVTEPVTTSLWLVASGDEVTVSRGK